MESAHFANFRLATSERRHEDVAGGSGDTRLLPLATRAIR